MRRSLLLIGSAALNLILLAAVIFPRRPAATVPELAGPDSTPAAAPARFHPQITARKQFFSWSEVESPDYLIYIARLREIGCPEQTIRDIVIADVDQLYSRKRLDEVPTPDQEWWRSGPDTNLLAAASAKEESLELERRALLNTLLGPNWRVEDTLRELLPLNGPVLGDLSPELKQAVRDIVAKSQTQADALLSNSQTNAQPSDTVGLVRLEQQTRAQLAKVLTPAQLEEFLLRYSSNAEDLRNRLRNLQVTPDEFRKLFQLRDPIFQQLQLADTAGAPPTATATLQKQLEDSFATVLGPERYRAYQLAQDPDYRAAVAQVASNDAPASVVNKIYQVRQAAKDEQNRINNDPNLTPEQKAAQLQAVDQQVQAANSQLLGTTPPEPPPAPPQPPPLPLPPAAIHAYAPGETIDQIAAQYGVTSSSILNANSDINLNALKPGTPIKIPQKVQPTAPAQ